jgi:hypothetical protein
VKLWRSAVIGLPSGLLSVLQLIFVFKKAATMTDIFEQQGVKVAVEGCVRALVQKLSPAFY